MTKLLWACNRSYFVSPNSNANHIIKDLAVSGCPVNGTHEFLNARVVFSNIERSDAFVWKGMGANIFEVNALMRAIHKGDNTFVSATYDSNHYTFLKDAVDKARTQFNSDCVETRRAVIQFPENHCFETIQVLVRDKHVIIATNMRSCNAYKNLMNDAYLAYMMAMGVAHGFEIERCSMTMSIGSLHLFEEDFKYVL